MKKRFFPALLPARRRFRGLLDRSEAGNVVSGPHTELNEFTVGQKMMRSRGRHAPRASDYDFDVWQGSRCNNLSALDECILDCLSRAGTVSIGEACYSGRSSRLDPAERGCGAAVIDSDPIGRTRAA